MGAAVEQLERSLVAAVLLDPPAQARACREIVSPDCFRDGRLAAVYRELLTIGDAGVPGDLALLADELDHAGVLEQIGGLPFLATLLEEEPSPTLAPEYARRMRRHALHERVRALHAQVAAGDDHGETRAQLAAAEVALAALDAPEARPSYVEMLPTRDELKALAAAPPIVPLVTHLLYPGTTTVLVGQTNTGKTTAALRAALDLCAGREPWTGRYDGSDPRRVLIVSKDDTTLSLVRKAHALAPDGGWMRDGRLGLIGKEKRPLALDGHGAEVLGNTIADGAYDAFVIDPYQHFLPAGLTVNDDDGARHTIATLDSICASLGCAGLLIHHPRKRAPKAKSPQEMTKGERLEEIRGSAVLAQLARAVATLWETEPGYRMLDAVVNDVPPLSEMWFQTSRAGDFGVRWEIAGPPIGAEEREIRAGLAALEPGTYNATALARLLFAIPARTKPSGPRRTQAKTWARRIADEQPERFSFKGDGVLEVFEVPR